MRRNDKLKFCTDITLWKVHWILKIHQKVMLPQSPQSI